MAEPIKCYTCREEGKIYRLSRDCERRCLNCHRAFVEGDMFASGEAAEDWATGDPDDRPEEEEFSECPEHGQQLVKGHGTINEVDPYRTNLLACGHTVVCFGPDDPMTIVGKWTSGDLVPERYR